jgi:hypothetical protein
MTAINHDTSGVKCRGQPLGEILWQGRQWAVTRDGIEARDGTYALERKRLTEDFDVRYSWVEHVGTKGWVDIEDFTTAYLVAIALFGIKLRKTDVATIERGYRNAVQAKEISALHHEMFPTEPGTLRCLSFNELTRECKLVDAEYRRRRAT